MGKRTLHLILLSAIAFRIALLFVSIGSNDIRTWNGYGDQISTHGLRYLYDNVALFNHPPLAGVYAWAVSVASSTFGIPFYWLFKFPMLLADLFSAYLIYSLIQVTSADRSDRTGIIGGTLYVANPATALISSYHGNTDALCACFCVLAYWLMIAKSRPLLAGIAAGLALNVKIIAVPFLLPFLILAADNKARKTILVGGSIAIMPIVLAAYLLGAPFIHNVFHYQSKLEFWGITALLCTFFSTVGTDTVAAIRLLRSYQDLGRYLIVLTVLVGNLALLRRKYPHRSTAGYLWATGTFIILAPGFGLQYLIYPLTAAFISNWRRAFYLSLHVAIFLVSVYSDFLETLLPLESVHTTPFLGLSAVLGISVWAHFVWLIFRQMLEDASPAKD